MIKKLKVITWLYTIQFIHHVFLAFLKVFAYFYASQIINIIVLTNFAVYGKNWSRKANAWLRHAPIMLA